MFGTEGQLRENWEVSGVFWFETWFFIVLKAWIVLVCVVAACKVIISVLISRN